MALAPIPSMIRGYSGSQDREDRICQTSVWICKEQAFWLVTGVVLLYTLIEEKRFGSIWFLMTQSSTSGPNTRVPIGRLFIKVFFWFWLTVLALFAIFLASRMLGTRLVPPTDVATSFAPRVADEAAHAYESGGPQEFEQFDRRLVGKSGVELYLIDGYGKDVLSRPVPSDSFSIVRAARSDGRILSRYGARSHSSSYKFTSPSGHPYVLLVRAPLQLGRFLGATAGGGLPFFGVVLLIVTLFCFWLTHHIVAPIQGIQSAARMVAAGDLSVRAPVEISKRHDELAAIRKVSSFAIGARSIIRTLMPAMRMPIYACSLRAVRICRTFSSRAWLRGFPLPVPTADPCRRCWVTPGCILTRKTLPASLLQCVSWQYQPSCALKRLRLRQQLPCSSVGRVVPARRSNFWRPSRSRQETHKTALQKSGTVGS